MHNILAGLLVGTIVGLTGMGGASLMAPILIYLFHVKVKTAIGTDLAYATVAKVFGAAQQHQAGTVDHRLVWRLAAGSVPASLAGVWTLNVIGKHAGKSAETVLTHLLGVMLVVVAVVILARTLPNVEAWFERRRAVHVQDNLPITVLTGAVGGFLVGLTSIGAGTLFGVALILIFGVRLRKTVGTDIFHGCVLSAVAAAGHMFVGDVDFGLAGALLIGAIPGILIGGYFSTRMPERALRPALGSVILLSGLKILG